MSKQCITMKMLVVLQSHSTGLHTQSNPIAESRVGAPQLLVFVFTPIKKLYPCCYQIVDSRVNVASPEADLIRGQVMTKYRPVFAKGQGIGHPRALVAKGDERPCRVFQGLDLKDDYLPGAALS